jgi:BASS family bile acid:Na+ symporter
MHRVAVWLERHFTVCFSVAVLGGVFLPSYTRVFGDDAVMYALGVLLALSFLKVDVAEILSHARRPGLLAYALAIDLVAMPALAFAGALPCDDDARLGLVLLAAMPTGVAAAAIAGMVGARTGLTLLLCVLSSLLAPLTIPAVLYVLFGARVELEYASLFSTLAIMVAVPLTVSQATKWLSPRATAQAIKYGGGVAVLILCCIITSVIAREAAFIRANVADVFAILGALYLGFAALQFLGYVMGFWLAPDEKLALSVSKTVMNNTLGIVVATRFFPDAPRVALVLILSAIPWSTVPALYRFYRARPSRDPPHTSNPGTSAKCLS